MYCLYVEHSDDRTSQVKITLFVIKFTYINDNRRTREKPAIILRGSYAQLLCGLL